MTESKSESKPKSSWLNLLVDYAPIMVFFAVYRYFSPADRENSVSEVLAVVKGTAAFMVAAVAALLFSKLKFGRISPMLWLSTLLIVGFGSVTVFLRDPVYIQLKPTAIYLLFGVVLLAGVARRKAYLKVLLEAAFEGLNDDGWLKLSRNWGLFFFVLAALNEALRFYLTFGEWIGAKLYVFLPLTFLFTFVQIPMLLRHGLAADEGDKVLMDEPPPQ